MKVFLDAEFTGLHQNTTLISMGLVSEDGLTFYAEFTDYASDQIDDWLQENVLDNLLLQDKKDDYIAVGDWTSSSTTYKDMRVKGSMPRIKEVLTAWLTNFETVEIWSDCLAYDWVLFNQLFGHAFNIPERVHYIPRDICTLFRVVGIDPDISREDYSGIDTIKHNALEDAMIIKACYEKLEPLWDDRRYYVYIYYDENMEPFYVGRGTGRRIYDHLRDSSNRRKDGTYYNPLKVKKIQESISTLGEECFVSKHIKIYASGLSRLDASNLEKKLVFKFGRLNNGTGVLTNLINGGSFNIGNYAKSPETKKKISRGLLGKSRTLGSRNKQSKSITGEGNPMYGKTHSEDTKNKIRKANSKSVIIEDIKYESITQAAKSYGVSNTTIYRWLLNN